MASFSKKEDGVRGTKKKLSEKRSGTNCGLVRRGKDNIPERQGCRQKEKTTKNGRGKKR